MLRTLGIKTRLLVLAAPVVVVTVLAVVLGLVSVVPLTAALLFAGVGVVGIVCTMVGAAVVASTITTPLHELGAAADEVAESLPVILERAQKGEKVSFAELPVEGEDEIARLTASVNSLSTQSVNFAKGQAGSAKNETDTRAQIANMFVNVARRDQTLLKRLLSLLDQLERSEENPDTLDALFRLDHLATRMRRNAESLLVLAGRESSRRRRQPMPLTDVVRSASSEIEHYERVDLAQYTDPAMLGHAALATAHLLAELLENATRYSDPGSRVSVETRSAPRGIQITILDTGLGMSAEELQKFNDRIANPPAEDVIAAEKLGFYVVGRLALKLESKVVLAKGESKGTVVTVDLPSNLFVPGSVATSDEPATDFGAGPEAGWASQPDVPAEAPKRIAVTPDLSAAASALSELSNDGMLAPEIVAAPARPGSLPGRASLPGRSRKPEPATDAAPTQAEPVAADAKAAPATPVAEPAADKPEDKPAEASVTAPAKRPLARRGATEAPAPTEEPTRAPAPTVGAEALAAAAGSVSSETAPEQPTPGPARRPLPPRTARPEEPRVPSPRSDTATEAPSAPAPEGTRGGPLGGATGRTPATPPVSPTPARTPLARSGESRSAASELSTLSRPAAPQAPAPAPAPAQAPAAAPKPIVPAGIGALDILPSAGRGTRRRRQERAAAPMPNAAAIAAAAAAPDEGYVPEAFVPTGPIGGEADAGRPAAQGDTSSLSDVLRARSAMASQALSELSQLSGSAPLVRRQAGASEAGQYAAATQNRAPAAPSRPTRSAADVRSMLSGFQAGVARGRTTEGADGTGQAGEDK